MYSHSIKCWGFQFWRSVEISSQLHACVRGSKRLWDRDFVRDFGRTVVHRGPMSKPVLLISWFLFRALLLYLLQSFLLLDTNPSSILALLCCSHIVTHKCTTPERNSPRHYVRNGQTQEMACCQLAISLVSPNRLQTTWNSTSSRGSNVNLREPSPRHDVFVDWYDEWKKHA
jgi:surface polysaccharide O-acyltransferase-like enzyme